jgi:hypothetical protein
MHGPKLTRRGVLASSLAGAAGVLGCAKESPPNPVGAATGPCAGALAQSYTVVARIPNDGKYYYMHDPGLTTVPSGRLLVAAPCWTRKGLGQEPPIGFQTFLCRSDDGGKTWTQLSTLPYSDAAPFVHGGKTYMFVQATQFDGLTLVRSDDEGESWSVPLALTTCRPLGGLQPRGGTDPTCSFWNVSTPMLEDGGQLLWPLNSRGFDGGAVVLAADTSKDLMDAATWSMSTEAGHPHPQTPAALVRRLNPGAVDYWLEPNIVSVKGKLRVLLRTILDGYAAASLVMVCDLVRGEGGLALSFVQFAAMPGAQNKFFIVTDPETGVFWSLSNLVADSQELVYDWNAVRAGGRYLGGGGNDRRFLALSYSVDALNWFPAGMVATTPNPHQSFMYPCAVIDGDDLAILSRTSVDGGTQHDADRVTFHRVKNFRALAMDLTPRF